MAQTTSAKDRAGSGGRARGMTRRKKTQTRRIPRDTRTRSEAADKRRARRKVNPRARQSPKTKAAKRRGRPSPPGKATKNMRERRMRQSAEREGATVERMASGR